MSIQRPVKLYQPIVPMLLIAVLTVISITIIVIICLRQLLENSDHHIPIIIYYHIAELGNWRQIVQDQIKALRASGLYKVCQSIRVGYLGNKKHILDFLDSKVQLVYHSSNIKEYETPTINKLLTFAKQCNQNCYLLYIHNKGSSQKICNQVHGQYYWRKMMEYWLIHKYQLCVKYLAEGFLTCGINYMGNHYSGNFWWAQSQYLQTLAPLDINADRLAAEFWLFKQHQKNRHISMYGPYITSVNCSGLYGTKYIEGEYQNLDVKII